MLTYNFAFLMWHMIEIAMHQHIISGVYVAVHNVASVQWLTAAIKDIRETARETKKFPMCTPAKVR